MEWYLALIYLFGGFMLLAALGLPVAFAFLGTILAGAVYFVGPLSGPTLFTLSMFQSLTTFTLVPVPLFVLMGELLFHSGLAMKSIDAVAKWLGGVPARLSILAGTGGALFGILSGSSMANTAMLGSLLVPEMQERGYKPPMSVGPIVASGGLAVIIPPSTLSVIYATVAEISVGRLLIAGLLPGLLMGALYLIYIIVRAKLQPDLAPPYAIAQAPVGERLRSLAIDIVPLGFIVFLVVGLIFLGVATPTEAAAVGAVGSLLLAAAYRRLKWEVVIKSLAGTIKISSMALLIVAGSVAYSQLLAYTGITRGLVKWVVGLDMPTWALFLAMIATVLLLGAFMDQIALIMITVPLFMPIVTALGFNPIWFGVIMLIALEVGLTSPPFGMNLFVMKGVAPANITMNDIYRSALPFIVCDLVAMLLVALVPAIAIWLPGLMIK